MTIVDPSAPKIADREGIPIGQWNHAELAVGKRGFGKSTILLKRMDELNDEAGGAFKIGHSPGMRFPPNVTKSQICYHYSMASLDSKLHSKPNAFHVLVSEEADPVVDYVLRMGKATLAKAQGGWWGRFFGKKSPIGKKAIPYILLIDEMMYLNGAQGSSQGGKSEKWFRRFLISLRHNHIALLGGVQDSNSISYINASLATKLWLFRTSHEWALNSIRASGLPMEDLERLPQLGIGEYIEVDV